MSSGMKLKCFVHHSDAAAAALYGSELQKQVSSELLMNRRVSVFAF